MAGRDSSYRFYHCQKRDHVHFALSYLAKEDVPGIPNPLCFGGPSPHWLMPSPVLRYFPVYVGPKAGEARQSTLRDPRWVGGDVAMGEKRGRLASRVCGVEVENSVIHEGHRVISSVQSNHQ